MSFSEAQTVGLVLVFSIFLMAQPALGADTIEVYDLETKLLLYGSSFASNESGAGTETATWTPDITTAGEYDVYAMWCAYSNRASDAPYTIYYDGGSETVDVNQQINGGQWNYLGTYTFAAGTSGSIVLSDGGNGYVIADAVKLEQ